MCLFVTLLSCFSFARFSIICGIVCAYTSCFLVRGFCRCLCPPHPSTCLSVECAVCVCWLGGAHVFALYNCCYCCEASRASCPHPHVVEAARSTRTYILTHTLFTNSSRSLLRLLAVVVFSAACSRLVQAVSCRVDRVVVALRSLLLFFLQK